MLIRLKAVEGIDIRHLGGVREKVPLCAATTGLVYACSIEATGGHSRNGRGSQGKLTT